MEILTIFRWLVFVCYLVTFGVYARYFVEQTDRHRTLISYVMPVTVGFHFIYLILITAEIDHLPLTNVFEVMTSYVFIFTLIYYLIERSINEYSLGSVILPIAVVLQLVSNLFIDYRASHPEILVKFPFFKVHVSVILLAYSAFTISFIASTMYVLLSREIQKKQLGFFFSRLPSLELLDRLSNHAVVIGVSFISVGILIGIYMANQAWGGGWPKDPKLISVFVTWLIYVAYIYFRNARGWQGMRASVLSIAGFTWVLLSFVIFTIFFSQLHAFV